MASKNEINRSVKLLRNDCFEAFLAHSCWKQWMRYCGEADIDGVVDRGRKLHYGPWTEAVSHATPPHFVKVKINFDNALKLTWRETKCLYSLIKITISNHISELLKMQLESRILKARSNKNSSTNPVSTQCRLQTVVRTGLAGLDWAGWTKSDWNDWTGLDWTG